MKVLLTLCASALFAAAPVQAQDCGRDCLRNTLTRYLDALVKHDPTSLPLTASVRFTEDTRELPLGQGLWQTIDSLGGFRQDVLDPTLGVAGTHVKAVEAGTPVLVAIRLQMQGDRIAGVETMVVRNKDEGMIFNPDAVQTASAAMAIVPDTAQRASRAELERLARLYPEGLRVGSFVTADARFAPGAYRFENGQLMAGPSCTFLPGCNNIREQRLPTLAGIQAHVAALDEEQGIAWLRMNFGAGSLMRGEGELSVFEMFKIYDGQIQAVEAFMESVPKGTPFLWE